MSFKVIPYVANLSSTGSADQVAGSVENIIQQTSSEGWSFVQIQELTTYVAGTSGCFGLGAQPGKTVSISLLIFKK